MKRSTWWPRWSWPRWLAGLPISLALHLVAAVSALTFLRAGHAPTGLVLDLAAAERDEAARAAAAASTGESARPAGRATRRLEGGADARPAGRQTASAPPHMATARETPAGRAQTPAPADPPRTAPPASPPAAPPPPPDVAVPQPDLAPAVARDAPATTPAASVESARSATSPPGPSSVAPGRARAGAGEGGDPRATPGSDHVGSASAGGRDSGPGPGGGGAGDRLAAIGPGGGDGLGGDYGPYKARLRQRIQDSLRYPPAARRRGVSGTVQLEIAVQPDGSIGTVTVVASSTHDVLDRAAVDAVRGLPRMPFPSGLRPSAFTVRLPVVFELQ